MISYRHHQVAPLSYAVHARLVLAVCTGLLLLGCQSTSQPTIATVDDVDLDRFMGDWYVIAHIPTFIEKSAVNAIESYERGKPPRISTTFRFRKGFDEPVKTYHPTGFVRDDSDGHWGMQFLWPIKAEYRISYVDADYRTTIIGRTKRDYLWIMAREPELPAAELEALLARAVDLGYDRTAIRMVPQRWPEPAGAPAAPEAG
ncbi:MAG: lipocalin family protein [Pseudomonadota bacterium]